jgi:hypothetical protein
MRGGKGASKFLDVGSLCSPNERLRVLVVAVDVVVDGADEFFHAAEHIATQSVIGRVAKEVFPSTFGHEQLVGVNAWGRAGRLSNRSKRGCL